MSILQLCSFPALGWRWVPVLTSLFLATWVRSESGSDPGLRTNEVLVQVTFFLVSKTQTSLGGPTSGEDLRYSADSFMKVVGVFAGQITTPAPGQRSIMLFRRLPGQWVGTLNENTFQERIGIEGEGGVSEFHEVARADWKNTGVDMPPPRFDILIDLDASRWTLRNFSSAVGGMINNAIRGFSYFASYNGPDADGWQSWSVTADPATALPSLPGGNPGKTAAAAALLESSFGVVDSPQPLTQNGQNYQGQIPVTTTTLGTEYAASWSLEWRVIAAAPELELVVRSRDLEDWRPTAEPANPAVLSSNIRPLRGAPLWLSAEVVSPSGVKPVVRIRKLTWRLEGTSRLPGFAMNVPYKSSETSPDLEINDPRAVSERQTLELSDLTTLKNRISIAPYDWGGWTTLRVEAELDDGRILQGKLKGQSGDETAIRIPARDENSKVATSWKRRNQVSGLADDSDLDSFPIGGPDGDGFTLFEEYRGFYARELAQVEPGAPPVHLSTHPAGKTVFIYDRVNDENTRAGALLFRSASQAGVFRVKLEDGLLDGSRVMNANVGEGPSKGPQHAIGVRSAGNWGPAAPGRPGAAEVLIPPFKAIQQSAPALANTTLYRRAIAAHLLMACRVPRPGPPGDRLVTLNVARGVDGGPVVMTDRGERVTLRDEATGHDLGEEWLDRVERFTASIEARTRANLRGLASQEAIEAAARAAAAQALAAEGLDYRKRMVAVRGGQHSGPLNNIMRSAHAEGYRIEGTDTIVILTKPPNEVIGYQLPKTATGDGYNAPDYNRPRPRYGSSPNPAPRGQFHVSDHTP